MALLWHRRIIVNIPDLGLTITEPKISIDFNREVDSDEPPSGTVTIYNLKVDTQNALRIAASESRSITVAAGYGDVTPIIFTGNINKSEFKREEVVHKSTLRLTSMANTAHKGSGITNRTYQKGTTVRRVFSDIVGIDMGIRIGRLTAVPPELTFPYKLTYSGPSRGILNDVAEFARVSWYEENGAIHVNKPGSHRTDIPALVIRAPRDGDNGTGLIGIPQTTEEGISLECLLEPHATLGGVVQLYSSATGDVEGKIVKIHHKGDNWDGDFRTGLELRTVEHDD